MYAGGTVIRCNIQITKTLELGFRAVLGDDVIEIRFERAVG